MLIKLLKFLYFILSFSKGRGYFTNLFILFMLYSIQRKVVGFILRFQLITDLFSKSLKISSYLDLSCSSRSSYLSFRCLCSNATWVSIAFLLLFSFCLSNASHSSNCFLKESSQVNVLELYMKLKLNFKKSG